MNLSPIHHRIIKVLVEHHQTTYKPMKCEEIARYVNLSSGYIRNQMLILKNLKLIKSVPGRKGGYIPTACVYEKLLFHEDEELQIYQNKRLSRALLKEIQLRPPNNGILHIIGDIHDFKVGDRINIASKKLIVSGVVVGRDDMSNSLIYSIEVLFLRK